VWSSIVSFMHHAAVNWHGCISLSFAGVSVLLDMSPPPLHSVVLEGNLIFDGTQPNIELQAKYIVLLGGNLSIGTQVRAALGTVCSTRDLSDACLEPCFYVPLMASV
jgi:G8 domain